MADASDLQQAQLEEITEPVKSFILETFLPGEDPSALGNGYTAYFRWCD